VSTTDRGSNGASRGRQGDGVAAPESPTDDVTITWDPEPVERTAARSVEAGEPATEPTVAVSGPDAADRRTRRRSTAAATVEEPPSRAGARKGRRVRRVIRRIDLWSVLKLAIVLYTCLYAAVMGTLAVLWGLAYSSGQIEKVQSFMADVGMDNYRFYGDQMWRAAAMIGAIGVLAATIATVLTAALVNVISEMTGGIRVVVIEEDPPVRRRRAPERDAG
jgi:hypothetical protein